MSLATLPAWWWMSRLDWRRVALMAGVVFLTANLASAVVTQYDTLLAARFLASLAGGTLMILCISCAAGDAEPVAGLRLLGARATAVRHAWPAGAARPVRDLWPEGGLSDPRRHYALLFAAGVRFPSALSTALCLPPAAVDGAVASGAGGAGGTHFLYQPQRSVDLYRHHRQRGGG